MTTTAATVQYSRADGVLWRDTGEHVVVLLSGASSEVKVVGGGAALVWRLLQRPGTAADLLDVLAGAESGPSCADLEACLADLAGQRLVVASERS